MNAFKQDVVQHGEGPVAVVALHGIQGTRGSWLPVVALTQGACRWVLPNLRGRGHAGRGAGPADYTLQAYADDLSQVLAAWVPSGPYVLAGWSLGVSVALAALAGQRIRAPAGLLLVSGSAALCDTRWFEGEGTALTTAVAVRRQRLGLQAHADDRAVCHTWEAVRQTDQRPLLQALARQQPALPVAVLHGDADDDCPPSHGRRLAEGLGAPLQLLPGVGHALLSEAPAAVAAALTTLCHSR